MSDIKDNPPPLPSPAYPGVYPDWIDMFELRQVIQIEAAAFARGVAAGQAAMRGEIERLKAQRDDAASCLTIALHACGHKNTELGELRAKLRAPEEQKNLKKKLVWECNECGSQEYTMSVSEADVNQLGCGNCGMCEWHEAEEKP